MPFCDISKDVSLHYITNTPKGDASDLDRTKPTILLLPPIFFDVTWLREQFTDARLCDQYNLIAFDLRNMGQTKAPLSPRRDTWTDAADVAVAHELLQLPPCHVWANAVLACGTALRMAVLFPTKVLSLCVCTIPNQIGEDPDWVIRGYFELVDAWCFPQDMDTLDRAYIELSTFMFNGKISSELEDEVVAWWQRNLPPTNRGVCLAQALCALNRYFYTERELASIEQPTIFLQAEDSIHNPAIKAQEISDKMPNSRLFVVKGGPQFMTMVPAYASVSNRVYCQFLRNLPDPPTCQVSPPNSERLCREGLERLAMFADNPSIASRDPTDILSFSLLSSELIDHNVAKFDEFAKGGTMAFNTLDEHGQPIRKFSERSYDRWKPVTFEQGQHCCGGHVVTVVKSSSIPT